MLRKPNADEWTQIVIARASAVSERQCEQIVGQINGLNACHVVEGSIYGACDLK
jgi:hypothetical protein